MDLLIKVRRGKVGGFVDYMSEVDIKYLSQRISADLSDFYHFYITDAAN